MTAEEKLFILLGRNWLEQIRKGTLQSKNSAPEQETRKSDSSTEV